MEHRSYTGRAACSSGFHGEQNVTQISACVGGGTQIVSLSGIFGEQGVTAFRCTAVSSATSIATVSVSGATLTITPVNVGISTITVTAHADSGGTKQLLFSVTVAGSIKLTQEPAAAPEMNACLSEQSCDG